MEFFFATTICVVYDFGMTEREKRSVAERAVLKAAMEWAAADELNQAAERSAPPGKLTRNRESWLRLCAAESALRAAVAEMEKADAV